EEHARSDEGTGNEIQAHTGARQLSLAFADGVDDGRAGIDALVPAGPWVTDARRDDGGPHDREGQSGARNDLLADALGISIGVRPAPELSPLLAQLRKLHLHETAAYPLDFFLEHATPTRFASAQQVLLCLIQE